MRKCHDRDILFFFSSHNLCIEIDYAVVVVLSDCLDRQTLRTHDACGGRHERTDTPSTSLVMTDELF